MSTAAPTVDRLRQIAVLVSLVDSVAAQQLLSHLPPATAQHVLEISKQLGPISAEEKRQILTAFQHSASVGTAASPQVEESTELYHEQARSAAVTSGRRTASELSPADADVSTQASKASPWSKLEKSVLLRFLVSERPNVIAVVISQLDTKISLAILQDLGTELSCKVLQCLATLGDIDPLAKAAIEEHITERIGQHQDEIQNECENARRIEALLVEAPVELRRQWRLAMGLDAPPETALRGAAEQDELGELKRPPINVVEKPASPRGSESTPRVATTTTELVDKDYVKRDPVLSSGVNERPEPGQPLKSTENLDSELSIRSDQEHIDELNHSVIGVEFERLLDLPHHLLAQVLSTAGTRNVLLALAGATPSFIQRLYRLLKRRDRLALAKRIKQIEAASPGDTAQAQQQLIRVANTILKQQAELHTASRRAA